MDAVPRAWASDDNRAGLFTDDSGHERDRDNDERASRRQDHEGTDAVRDFFADRRRRPGLRRAHRWLEMGIRKRAELEKWARLEKKRGHEHPFGGDPPSDWFVACAIAADDCRDHPDDWLDEYLRDGELKPKFERSAANRIMTAIKRL
jgi:hypothetical protein